MFTVGRFIGLFLNKRTGEEQQGLAVRYRADLSTIQDSEFTHLVSPRRIVLIKLSLVLARYGQK